MANKKKKPSKPFTRKRRLRLKAKLKLRRK